MADVLIAYPDSLEAQELSTKFNSRGVSTIVAADVEAAKSIYRKERPHVVVTDLFDEPLNARRAYGLVREVRSTGRDTFVILLVDTNTDFRYFMADEIYRLPLTLSKLNDMVELAYGHIRWRHSNKMVVQ